MSEQDLLAEIHTLKESRAACVVQEQISRNEANRLRGDLKQAQSNQLQREVQLHRALDELKLWKGFLEGLVE